jgi:hypothetical protein
MPCGAPAFFVMRSVRIIDLLPLTIIEGGGRLQTVGVPVASSFCSGFSFGSLFSPGGGTGNAPLISLRPSLSWCSRAE